MVSFQPSKQRITLHTTGLFQNRGRLHWDTVKLSGNTGVELWIGEAPSGKLATSLICMCLNCLVVSIKPAVLLRPWNLILASSAVSSFSEATSVIFSLPSSDVTTVSSTCSEEEDASSEDSSEDEENCSSKTKPVRVRLEGSLDRNIRWVERGDWESFGTLFWFGLGCLLVNWYGMRSGGKMLLAIGDFLRKEVEGSSKNPSWVFHEPRMTGGPNSSEKFWSGRIWEFDVETLWRQKRSWKFGPVEAVPLRLPFCPRGL